MSGGVDSSVAAALLVEAGYDVVGLMMRLWSAEGPGGRPNACCTPQGLEDARRVAAQLGIPFYIVNYEREFRATVVDFFLQGYAAGVTPNPCLVCNRQIRFGVLLRQALSMGAQYLATGHYARVAPVDGRYQLWRAADQRKDQSYVLHVLGQADLAHVLFPVGEYLKPAVRELARSHGLPVADKAESQDICFLPDGDYRPFLEQNGRAGLAPGPIVNAAGAVLGEHRGLALYTVGQRHGLGLATGSPLYVTALDTGRNALVVGEADALLGAGFTAGDVTYVLGEPPAAPFACQVRLRYKAREAEALVTPLPGGRVEIRLREPQRAITPGQAAVFYQGDQVLGGGIIERPAPPLARS